MMRMIGLLVLGGCDLVSSADTSASGTDTSAATDADTDVDTDTDTDTDPGTAHPYTGYTGLERFDLYISSLSPDTTNPNGTNYNCQLVWDTVGTPLPIPAACEGCDFVFAVTGTMRTDETVHTGADCFYNAGEGFTFNYAYTPDYYGEGPAFLFGYVGTYLFLGAASGDFSELTYRDGYKDQPDYEPAYPNTYYLYGKATVTE